MRKEDLKGFENKKVKLILKSSSVFTGYILRISEESLLLNDKFGQDVVINLDQISNVITMNEERGEDERD